MSVLNFLPVPVRLANHVYAPSDIYVNKSFKFLVESIKTQSNLDMVIFPSYFYDDIMEHRSEFELGFTIVVFHPEKWVPRDRYMEGTILACRSDTNQRAHVKHYDWANWLSMDLDTEISRAAAERIWSDVVDKTTRESKLLKQKIMASVVPERDILGKMKATPLEPKRLWRWALPGPNELTELYNSEYYKRNRRHEPKSSEQSEIGSTLPLLERTRINS